MTSEQDEVDQSAKPFLEGRQLLWKLPTGVPWRDLSVRYGPWKTCHDRLRRWTADGSRDLILAQAQVYDGHCMDLVVSVDSSIVRAHHHSAGARKNGGHHRLRTRPSDGGHRDGEASAGPAAG